MMFFSFDSLAFSDGTKALLIRLMVRAAKTGKKRMFVFLFL
jgi:hypothetical protein